MVDSHWSLKKYAKKVKSAQILVKRKSIEPIRLIKTRRNNFKKTSSIDPYFFNCEENKENVPEEFLESKKISNSPEKCIAKEYGSNSINKTLFIDDLIFNDDSDDCVTKPDGDIEIYSPVRKMCYIGHNEVMQVKGSPKSKRFGSARRLDFS
ncbi:hypothetical protein EDEG_00822 [Edhazardia aedis USNM 41457]|uniref:Uncharacterized protein n=1 Tax=Edhazardia aedis (strain USNM 41457) TaxID=1003232 RepID=J9DBD6_EDHAE|nr:hypothetical protein EDEG_00822 [Edhazardia aedis USNM 41457]|eukprot:EJW05041.1 hypothetical protein EDEG_00822 [Edhazardia aedis USNM 41457]